MASVLLSPVGNSGIPFFDNNGIPLNAGLVYTYQAGSSTLLTTYTTVNGNIANPNPIVLNASGQMPNEVWLQTGYSYKFVIQTSANVTIQTLDNVYPILQSATASGATIPSGLIAIWSGSTGSIPSGWLICDGTSGTPDLRSSFIIGAGSTYSVGQTGGSADAIVVSHTHTVTDPGHKHNTTSTGSGSLLNAAASGATGANTSTTDTATTGITLQTAGTSGTGANLPPYYALAFIMKT
jgi:microcystin-dependent protein